MKDKITIMHEMYSALQELVELKHIKDTEGATEDYLKRKPLAWSTAKRIVREHREDSKYWGAKADTGERMPTNAQKEKGSMIRVIHT